MILKPDGKEVARLEGPESMSAILTFMDRHTKNQKPHPALEAQFVVQLRFPKLRKLSENAERKIAERVIALLLTSQLNSQSEPAKFEGGVSRVQKHYRQTAAVTHLALSFVKPQAFSTIGGKITVAEIVVGLSQNKHRSLFTVDADGRVVEHSGESLAKGAALLTTIHQLLAGPKPGLFETKSKKRQLD
jgi:hypothetical protein